MEYGIRGREEESKLRMEAMEGRRSTSGVYIMIYLNFQAASPLARHGRASIPAKELQSVMQDLVKVGVIENCEKESGSKLELSSGSSSMMSGPGRDIRHYQFSANAVETL